MKVAFRLGDKVLLFLNEKAGRKAIKFLNQAAVFDYEETAAGPRFREMSDTKKMNPIPGIMVLEDDDPRLEDYRKICREVLEAEQRLSKDRAAEEVKAFMARFQTVPVDDDDMSEM